MKRGIVIAHNGGIGDLVVMNGCVRFIASCHDIVYLLCLDSRTKHYAFAYRDDPNIIVYPIPHENNSIKVRHNQDLISKKIIEENTDIDWTSSFRRTYWTTPEEWKRFSKRFKLDYSNDIWPELFYAIMGVPYEKRYEYYHIQRDPQREKELKDSLVLPEKYAFVVDKTRKWDYNFEPLTSLPIINPIKIDPNNETYIFDWMSIIEGASEIHTVDTSWLHLIRMTRLQIPKFYYQLRVVPMNSNDKYLNDSFDNGWWRIRPPKFKQKQIDQYWLK
jgi:hypothetical protein